MIDGLERTQTVVIFNNILLAIVFFAVFRMFECQDVYVYNTGNAHTYYRK